MFSSHRQHILESLQVQLAYLVRKRIERRREEARQEAIRIAAEKAKAKHEAEIARRNLQKKREQ